MVEPNWSAPLDASGKQVSSDGREASGRAEPLLTGLWWFPLAFVVLALVLLAVTPIIVDRRVSALRNSLTYGTQRARVLINDLEAAFGTQLLVNQRPAQPGDTAASATRAHLDSDEVELRGTAQLIGPSAVAHFDTLTELLQRWNAAPHDTISPGDVVNARHVFATAERFDGMLTAMADTQRAHVRRLEQFDVVSAAVLVPIALAAIAIVMWTGGRILKFARVAERERAEVVRSSEARAALLRGVTHDVKNPLGAAAGYAQLLEEGMVGDLSDSQSEMVRRIHRLVHTSVSTVTDLLELARADGGQLPVDYEHADLAAIAEDTVEDHRGMARERGLTIHVESAPTPVVTAPLRVRQVLANLLSNAIKYTPSGGAIAVRIVRDEMRGNGRPRRVGVEVADTGPGISPELRGRLFEEFFRVRGASGEARGNGLGLAISRRLARLLGGDVTFREADPHGAIFTLWIDPGESRAASAQRATA